MSAIIDTLAAEVGDLSAVQAAQLTVRLLVAAAVGGLVGWERGQAGKAAGVRTHILVAAGSAAFVTVPVHSGVGTDGVARIMQGLIAGIGFLGAGCILKRDQQGEVRGLTTAAGIWLTAAVGVAAGLGRLSSALMIGVLGWFTLAILGRWEYHIARKSALPPGGTSQP
jgi:putative Mg2+ transporter-C (MgtC) family protein